MPMVIAAAVAEIGASLYMVQAGAYLIYYANVIGYAAFIGGSIAYSSSQNAKLRRAMNNASLDQGRAVMVRDPLAARRLIYGRCRVSGTIVFLHTTGAKNQYLHLVVVLAGHEVDAITDIYFNDELVELNGSNVPTGKYATVALINKHRGDAGATADADLVAECGGLWTTDHKLSGCAYLAIKLLWSPDLFPNGLPTISAIVRGKKVYDPRTTTTAWSENVALCVADYLTDATFGKGIAYARIVEADLIEAANICDEAVGLDATLSKTGNMVSGNRHIGCASCTGILPGYKVAGTGIPTGTVVVSVDTSGTFFTVDQDPTATNAAVALTIGDTEARYSCNGTITSDQRPADILQDLAGAMAGHIVDTGGKWTVRAGAWRTPALTLTDGDLSGSFSVQPRQSRQDTFNGVKGVFISPANDWAPADFPAIKNDTYMADDGGLRLWRDVQYNFTTSPAMAQRLAKIELERGRQQITCTGTYMLKAMQCMPGDVIAVTRSRLGWSSKYFEVVDWEFKQTGETLGVVLNLRETASGVWDWADGEETTIDLAPNSNLPDPFTVPTPSTPTLTSTTTVQSDGTVMPRFTVTWTTPNNIYVEQGGFISVEFKVQADSAWMEWGRVRGDLLSDTITGVVIGEIYDVRLRCINSSGVRGSYSATASLTVGGDTTAPSTPTGLAATAGTGKSISLAWTANGESDLAEYRVYRSATVGGTYSLVAEVSANRFVDVDVSYSTPYYYKVSAVDFSENESAQTAYQTATTGSTPAGIDTTAPTDPDAATKSTEGTYQATDGSTRSYLTINVPAMPTGGVVLNVLYRRNGSTGWLLADQRSTGGSTTRIDDLSPGISYEVACQAFSAYGYGSGIVTATSSPFTAPSDSTGPSTPTGLAPAEGTGKSVSLDWSDNTEADFSEYGIYRNTVNNSTTATKIAETRASRFVDVEVTLGTTYYYWVTAFDRSENESGKSSAVNATPSAVAASSTDATAPTTPSASTYSASGTYSSGDGTVFAYISISVPALPALAKYQNVLYKKNGGGGDWLIAAQITNTGAQTVRIDDLIPGIAYDIAVIAFSAFAIPSAITTATSSPMTAPNKSAATSAISSTSLVAPTALGVHKIGAAVAYGAIARFTAPSDQDLVAIEIKAVSTNSETSVTYTWSPPGSAATLVRFPAAPAQVFNIPFLSASLTGGFVFARTINASGVYSTTTSAADASGWTAISSGTNITSVATVTGGGAAFLDVGTASGTVMAGDDTRIAGAALKASNLSDLTSASSARTNLGLGSLATQNSSAASVTSIKVGSGSSTPSVLTRYSGYANVTLSGGATSESFTIDLTNMGFSTKPDMGILSSIDPTYVVVYNRGSGSSTSTSAYCTIKSTDGSNIPSTTTPIMFLFEEV